LLNRRGGQGAGAAADFRPARHVTKVKRVLESILAILAPALKIGVFE
jgi:hypothetical protein